jgi:hypothetical protein
LGDITDVGLDGLLGLTFTTNGYSDLTETLGPVKGQPFHFNIFDQFPALDNFIGLSLSRPEDPTSHSGDASFAFNEVDPLYSHIVDTAPIPLFPGDNGR